MVTTPAFLTLTTQLMPSIHTQWFAPPTLGLGAGTLLKYFYCISLEALVLVLSASTTIQVYLLHQPWETCCRCWYSTSITTQVFPLHLPWCFGAGTLCKYQYSSISIAPALRHWCWYSLRVSQLKYFYCTSPGALVLVLSVSTTTQVFLLHLPWCLGSGTHCEYHYSSI